jgi:hypothetical protein
MDGRAWGIEGAPVVSPRLVVLLPATDYSVQFRVAPDVDAGVLSAQYAGDTIVTSLSAATRRVSGPESQEKQNLSQRCCGPSGMTRENGKLYLRSLLMTGVVRGDGPGVAVGSRSTRNSDGHH